MSSLMYLLFVWLYSISSHAGFPYCIFVVSCFVAFVIDMLVLFLQIELDPVMKTHDLLAILGFPHKHVFKSTGILPVMYNNHIHILQIHFLIDITTLDIYKEVN